MNLTPHYLNELKQLVLEKTGIRSITPGDCIAISRAINKAANKYVSETTIKRMYGFAMSNNNPSKYTITAFCEYIGQSSWEEFCATMDEKDLQTTASNWDYVHKRAVILTDHTLKTIKNRAGIPYELTISRKFAEIDLSYFLKSRQSFTCLVSKPGNGKSILLSHIVDKFFYSESALYPETTLWFLNANTLLNNSSFEVERWLNEQLGFNSSQNLIDNITWFTNEKKTQAVLILDGLDESILKKDKLLQLSNMIADLLCNVDDHIRFKMILVMRPSIWINFYQRIRTSAHLKSQWYPGNPFRPEYLSNIPLLTDKEINQILRNIDSNFGDDVYINLNLRMYFRSPSYIQLYYQMQEAKKKNDYQKDLTLYEFTSFFINHNIYLSRYSTEKIFLLKKFIQQTNNGEYGYSIQKIKLLNYISIFPIAYEDLLFNNVLIEEKHPASHDPGETIRFFHPHLFKYFLHLEILEMFNEQVDSGILNYITTKYRVASQRLTLVQWIIWHLIIHKNIEPLIDIIHLPLISSEKNNLILFISDTLKYKSSHIREIFKNENSKRLHRAIIEELLNFNLVDPLYNDAIQSLIELEAHQEDTFIYLQFSAYISVIRLDKSRLLNCIKEMKRLDSVDSTWLFDPIECFELIYSKMNNDNLGNDDIHKQIQLFIQDPHSYTKSISSEITPEEKISYFIILLVNAFDGNLQNIVSIIESITLLQPTIFEEYSSGFPEFLLHMYGLASARMKNYPRVIETIAMISQKGINYKSPTFSTVLYLTIIAEIEREHGNYNTAIRYINDTLDICKKNEIALNQIRLYYNEINIHQLKEDKEKMWIAINKLQQLMEEKNISINTFKENLNYNIV